MALYRLLRHCAAYCGTVPLTVALYHLQWHCTTHCGTVPLAVALYHLHMRHCATDCGTITMMIPSGAWKHKNSTETGTELYRASGDLKARPAGNAAPPPRAAVLVITMGWVVGADQRPAPPGEARSTPHPPRLQKMYRVLPAGALL